MKAKILNNYHLIEIIDTDNLENDSGEEWTEDLIREWCNDIEAEFIEIL